MRELRDSDLSSLFKFHDKLLVASELKPRQSRSRVLILSYMQYCFQNIGTMNFQKGKEKH